MPRESTPPPPPPPPPPRVSTRPCGVCRGRGMAYVESDNGRSYRSFQCKYCQGTGKNTFWEVEVPRRRADKRRRMFVFGWIYVGAMFWTMRAFWWYPGDTSPLYPWLQLLHVALVLFAILVAIGLIVAHRKDGTSDRVRTRNRRFTSDEEKLMGSAAILGLAWLTNRHAKHKRPPGL